MANRINTSPLTGRIYSGRVNKAGNAWVGEKQDATSDVLRAVVEKAEFHGGSFDVEAGNRKWIVELEMLHANRTEGISNAMVQAGYMFLIVHYEEMIQERDPVEMAKARETVEQRLREQHPAQADEHIENWRAFRPALRTAPTSAAGATKPDELTSSPEPESVEALAHRMAWRYKKSSDPAHSDTYTFNRATLLDFAAALLTPRVAVHMSRASGLLPVAREGLSDEQIKVICRAHIRRDTSADKGSWPQSIAFARAIEAAHGIAPASGDAPGEAK